MDINTEDELLHLPTEQVLWRGRPNAKCIKSELFGIGVGISLPLAFAIFFILQAHPQTDKNWVVVFVPITFSIFFIRGLILYLRDILWHSHAEYIINSKGLVS